MNRIDFLMVIMASGIARGRIHMTATAMATQSHNMAAILQIMCCQRHAALVYCLLCISLILDIQVMIN